MEATSRAFASKLKRGPTCSTEPGATSHNRTGTRAETTTHKLATTPSVSTGSDHQSRLVDRSTFNLGGASDTLELIVVLISIITILSATSVEATVKGVIALALSIIALTMGNLRRARRTDELSHVIRTPTSVLDSSDELANRWQRIARLSIGSVAAGAVLAVVLAVLLSTIATQLLNRLG